MAEHGTAAATGGRRGGADGVRGARRRAAVVAALVAAALPVLAGCSSGGGAPVHTSAAATATGAPAPAGSPLPANEAAPVVAARLQALRTARTVLVATIPASLPGGPFSADMTGVVDFVANDADLHGSYDGGTREYRIVHGVQYLSLLPGEGRPGQQWTRDPDPTALPGAALGAPSELPAVLAALTGPSLVGVSGGVAHYTAGVDATRFAAALGTAEDGPFITALGLLGLRVDLFAQADGTPVRILVRAGDALCAPADAVPTAPPPGTVATFAVQFTGFGVPVSVTPPPTT